MSNSPAPHPDVLDRPVNETTLVELYDDGLISAEARDAALELTGRTHHWWLWANRSLLFIGTALVLAGVVFFFAYNWSSMHAVAKFGVIEVGIWVCAIAAVNRGQDRITGKVLLLAASVLVGVLLAVYGQVYQTGADDWKIYTLWAILILPWTVIGRFNALWMLWLVVTNAAWLLFWFQMEPPKGFSFEFGIFLILSFWNSVALIVREKALSLGIEWIGGAWARHVIWFAVLVYLTFPTLVLIVETDVGGGSSVVAIALVIAIILSHLYFRYRQPDLLCVGFNLLSICIVFDTVAGNVLFEFIDDEAAAALIFGFVVLGTFSGAAFYLRNLARKASHGQS